MLPLALDLLNPKDACSGEFIRRNIMDVFAKSEKNTQIMLIKYFMSFQTVKGI